MKEYNLKNTIQKKEFMEKKTIKFLFLMIIILVLFCISKKKIVKYFNRDILINKFEIYLDKYEENYYNKIKDKIIDCSRMWSNQRQFLNGAVRKFKPKKILELGVAEGGSSIIILNALQDIKNSHLYSIDLSSHPKIGSCLKNIFPHFLKKWSLYTGNIAAKFIEEIGGDIDMAFIDTSHLEPGEILDFLIILPFLKEGAVVGFHDIGNQITKGFRRTEFAPYIIFNILRGKKYLPSGNNILTHDIGFVELEKNQSLYVHDYFRALGGQWQYFPSETDINLIRELFTKYYDKKCLIMFEETVKFNRIFVKNNPIKTSFIYRPFSKELFKKYFKNN